jgi:hypothetical protein
MGKITKLKMDDKITIGITTRGRNTIAHNMEYCV